jgi:hypothetical protein
MASDFGDIIVHLVHEAEPDLDERLEVQAEELIGLECTNPLFGKWIDAYEVGYLLSAFALKDDDFAEHFPKLAHISQENRNEIIKAFETHIDNCAHCHRKRGYDMELDSRIERAFRQHQTRRQKSKHLPQKIAEPSDSEERGKLIYAAKAFRA